MTVRRCLSRIRNSEVITLDVTLHIVTNISIKNLLSRAGFFGSYHCFLNYDEYNNATDKRYHYEVKGLNQ